MEYLAESKWTGWFGGWGSESDIAAVITRRSGEGWRLVSTKSERALWNFWLPRIKLLMVFERERPTT